MDAVQVIAIVVFTPIAYGIYKLAGIIIKLAKLKKAIEELEPTARKVCIMARAAFWSLFMLPCWLWYRPSIGLIKGPSGITRLDVQRGSGIGWTSDFTVELQRKRTTEEVEVCLDRVRMVVKQGCGILGKRVSLTLDSRETDREHELSEDSIDIAIRVRSSQFSHERRAAIDLNKRYQWKISGIRVRVSDSLGFRSLKTLRGSS